MFFHSGADWGFPSQQLQATLLCVAAHLNILVFLNINFSLLLFLCMSVAEGTARMGKSGDKVLPLRIQGSYSGCQTCIVAWLGFCC